MDDDLKREIQIMLDKLIEMQKKGIDKVPTGNVIERIKLILSGKLRTK